jgi:plasmid stabilization system protein ParE
VEKRRVILSPEALGDIESLYDHIAAASGPLRAIRYIERIEAFCLGFELAGQRGHRRDDIRPGLRIVGFERRITIAFHVDAKTVMIDRILYGGRNVARALTP